MSFNPISHGLYARKAVKIDLLNLGVDVVALFAAGGGSAEYNITESSAADVQKLSAVFSPPYKNYDVVLVIRSNIANIRVETLATKGGGDRAIDTLGASVPLHHNTGYYVLSLYIGASGGVRLIVEKKG